MSFKIGIVTHYYEKTKIAIVNLDGALSVGDRVRFVRHGKELSSEVVESIQIGHEKVSYANKGDVIGVKLTQEVREDAEVYKV
jgi:hypothetical protein